MPIEATQPALFALPVQRASASPGSASPGAASSGSASSGNVSAGEAPATPEEAAAQRAAYPNPASRLDPELHMVIMEFRDPAGRITETLPTSQQLEQFRLNLDANNPHSVSKWG